MRNRHLKSLLNVLIVSLLFLSNISFADNSKVLNVYNWTGYMPEKVIQLFEKKTGITIHYSTFTSNEILYAKLKTSPNSGYDLIVPSADFVDKMRRQGMLLRIDHKKIPNLKYLNPDLLNKPFDPHNHYSIPYLWGTTGIIVNTRYYSKNSITSWKQLWQHRFRNKLLLLNSAQPVFGMALHALGYSINTRNPKQIKEAYEKLLKLIPNIKLYDSAATQTFFMDGDAVIGMSFNGDAFLAHQGNPKIVYIYPKDRALGWIDNLAIPKNAPHLKNVYTFINFLLQPKIAKMISMAAGYSSPNLAAIKLMPKNYRDSNILNPSAKILRNIEFEADVGKANILYQKYFEMLKLQG